MYWLCYCVASCNQYLMLTNHPTVGATRGLTLRVRLLGRNLKKKITLKKANFFFSGQKIADCSLIRSNKVMILRVLSHVGPAQDANLGAAVLPRASRRRSPAGDPEEDVAVVLQDGHVQLAHLVVAHRAVRQLHVDVPRRVGHHHGELTEDGHLEVTQVALHPLRHAEWLHCNR